MKNISRRQAINLTLSAAFATSSGLALYQVLQDDEALSYSEFLEAAHSEGFETIEIRSNRVIGIYPEDQEKEDVTALIPNGAMPFNDLRDAPAKIEGYTKPSFFKVALPILGIGLALTSAVLTLNPKLLKKLVDESKEAKVKTKHEDDKVTLDDVKGIDEAKAELEEVLDYLKNPKSYHDKRIKVPTGVMLVGDPGGGKTMLARALSNDAGVPFYYVSASSIDGRYIGDGSGKIEDLFEQARKNRPAIIFIDEFDSVGQKRRTGGAEKGHRYENDTINQLLTEMDGFEQNDGIVVIGATNLIETIDPALMRPGRFTLRVDVPLPDIGGRAEILKSYADKIPATQGIDASKVAKMCPGMAGAELKEVVNSAALIAHRAGRNSATLDDFSNARDRLIMGIENKSQYTPPETQKLVAQHELGHAFVGHHLKNIEIDKISIIPRRNSLGVTVSLPPDETGLHSKQDLKGRLAQIFGGRAAEKIYCEDENYTSGAHGDIQSATDIARKMVEELGMSDDEDLGAVRYAERTDISEATRSKIDKAVVGLLNDAEDQAKGIIEEYKTSGAFDAATKVLLEKENISGEELDAIIAKYPISEPS